ncbi:MAG: hypothetical protein LBU73_07935 [Helicobacteraceae bacterium]|jgi:hypothetical protein|nr:hypothetical protein [Helicobacteraceae bacterium]
MKIAVLSDRTARIFVIAAARTNTSIFIPAFCAAFEFTAAFIFTRLFLGGNFASFGGLPLIARRVLKNSKTL